MKITKLSLGSLRNVPRNVWATTLTSFLTDISSEMIFTLVPLFLANVLGISTALIGLIDGISETTSSLLKGFSGWLSDRLGRRKGLAVAGYSLSSVAKPFLYIATTWYGVLAVRFVDRVGKGIRTSPRDALIADSTDEHHRGIAFGLHRAGDTAGAVVGLAIALLVVLATQAQALEMSNETFRQLVLIGIVPGFLAVAVLVIGAREPKRVKSASAAPQDAPTEQKISLRFGALNRDFRVFLVVVAIFALGNSSDAFLILRAQERGLNVPGVLGMLITFNLIYSIFSGPLGALSDRLGRRRLIVAGWLGYGLIYIGFALAETGAQIWLIFGLYGLYYAAVEGTARALVADLIPVEQRGTAYGYYNAVVGLMALPASLLAGILWQGIGTWQGLGPSAPFAAGALLALTAVTLWLIYSRSRRGAAVSA
ncbi:MFS transporter [Anaerolineae bacterium CFX9]|nr:MFS transporter [Anaerolineae bacterium CFX9]